MTQMMSQCKLYRDSSRRKALNKLDGRLGTAPVSPLRSAGVSADSTGITQRKKRTRSRRGRPVTERKAKGSPTPDVVAGITDEIDLRQRGRRCREEQRKNCASRAARERSNRYTGAARQAFTPNGKNQATAWTAL